MVIWLIYPYEILSGLGGRPGRSEMIATSLVEDGHCVTLWTSDFDHRTKRKKAVYPDNFEFSKNFFIKTIPTIGYDKNISLRRILSEYIFGLRFLKIANLTPPPDVLIISEPSTFYWHSINRYLKNKMIFMVIDVIDLWPELFKVALPKFIRKFHAIIFAPLYRLRVKKFQHADGVISVSRAYDKVAKNLTPDLAADRFRVVYYGVELNHFRDLMKSNNKNEDSRPPNHPSKFKNSVNIVFASTLGNNYDVLTILECVPILEMEGLNFNIFIAGSGPLEGFVLNQIQRSNSTRIHFLGNPNIDQMSDIYSYCDIGISGYINDSPVSIPIKAFHYSAAGLAVINSLQGEYAELLLNSGAGIQYEAQNRDSLAKAISMYCHDRSLLDKAKKASYLLGSNFDSKLQYLKFNSIVNLFQMKS